MTPLSEDDRRRGRVGVTEARARLAGKPPPGSLLDAVEEEPAQEKEPERRDLA